MGSWIRAGEGVSFMKRPWTTKHVPPRSPSERYGDLWGWVYVGVIVLLLVTIVGKALLKKG